MTTNRMFLLHFNNVFHTCFFARLSEKAWLWHFHYGHLNFDGLKTLQQKNMVEGLLEVITPSQICEKCTVGKQPRNQFPKRKSQRAKKVLELVHSDLCGPITPMSNGGK